MTFSSDLGDDAGLDGRGLLVTLLVEERPAHDVEQDAHLTDPEMTLVCLDLWTLLLVFVSVPKVWEFN